MLGSLDGRAAAFDATLQDSERMLATSKSGMRNQLVRRTTDVKKNIEGAQRYLNVLRERANVASEGKMVQLSEGLEQNTKSLCALQVSNSDAVHSLQILQVI